MAGVGLSIAVVLYHLSIDFIVARHLFGNASCA